MRVDSIAIGPVTVRAERADLYPKGSTRAGRSWELRASGVSGMPPLEHAWPAVTVRCGGGVYDGRVFADPDVPQLFGYLEELCPGS